MAPISFGGVARLGFEETATYLKRKLRRGTADAGDAVDDQSAAHVAQGSQAA